MMISTRDFQRARRLADERPIRVWPSRWPSPGWCWLCRPCQRQQPRGVQFVGWAHSAPAGASAAGVEHLQRWHSEAAETAGAPAGLSEKEARLRAQAEAALAGLERRLRDIVEHYSRADIGPVVWRDVVAERLRVVLDEGGAT